MTALSAASGHALVMAYGAVLAAELLGDRTFFAASALAARYRAPSVLAGLALGFAAKMGVAVFLGQFLGALPPRARLAASVASFAVAGVVIWRDRPHASRPLDEGASPAAGSLVDVRAALMAGAMVMSIEWADAGQIAAMAVTAQTDAPLLVWLGAMLALLTKGVVAVTVGAGVARRLSWSARRAVSLCALLVLGALTLIGGGE